MELLIGIVLGMIVMDLLWAWRMGIPQMLWHRWRHRNDRRPNYNEWSED